MIMLLLLLLCRRYLPPGGELPSKAVGQVRNQQASHRLWGCRAALWPAGTVLLHWTPLYSLPPVCAFSPCGLCFDPLRYPTPTVPQGTLLHRVEALERAMDTLLRAQVGGCPVQWVDRRLAHWLPCGQSAELHSHPLQTWSL